MKAKKLISNMKDEIKRRYLLFVNLWRWKSILQMAALLKKQQTISAAVGSGGQKYICRSLWSFCGGTRRWLCVSCNLSIYCTPELRIEAHHARHWSAGAAQESLASAENMHKNAINVFGQCIVRECAVAWKPNITKWKTTLDRRSIQSDTAMQLISGW